MANRKIAYTLGRGRAYIFDTSSTSGYMGEKYFQEFGPGFFDMSSASGYMGETYFQEFGPRFFDMSLESPGTGGTSIRLSLHETNETYPREFPLGKEDSSS